MILDKWTHEATETIELAKSESIRLGHNHVGTEHILLALLKGKGGIAKKILSEYGLNLEGARKEVMSNVNDLNSFLSGSDL
jgi:ATP-dependent Clp protease ATP-binding subunit ClpC